MPLPAAHPHVRFLWENQVCAGTRCVYCFRIELLSSRDKSVLDLQEQCERGADPLHFFRGLLELREDFHSQRVGDRS